MITNGFQFNVRVMLDFSPAVVNVLGALVNGRQSIQAAPTKAPAQAQPKEQEVASTDGGNADAKVEEAPKVVANANPTAADIRAAMDKTRSRIEGEDWETNKDSELRKKYHSQLTQSFKNLAAALGSEKPSTLTGNDALSFIEACDRIIVNDKGELDNVTPF